MGEYAQEACTEMAGPVRLDGRGSAAVTSHHEWQYGRHGLALAATLRACMGARADLTIWRSEGHLNFTF